MDFGRDDGDDDDEAVDATGKGTRGDMHQWQLILLEAKDCNASILMLNRTEDVVE